MNNAIGPEVAGAAPAVAAGARPTVLVLGATGFIGRALVERLLQEGVSLRALVRDLNPSDLRRASPGLEWVQGDLTDAASLEAALVGIHHVYHLARGACSSWDDHLKLDVRPSRQLAAMCAERGIALFYTSSIAIYDGGRAGERITESTRPSPASMRLNPYAHAKVATERDLAQLQEDQGLKFVVFRPGIVVGAGGDPRHPGVGAWPHPLTCRPWGGGRHPLPFVLVQDCADAMARALHRPDLAGVSFNLVGDVSLSGNAYLDALEKATGRPIRRLPVPAWRLFAQSVVRWLIKLLTRQVECPLPSYRYVDGLSCRATYCAERAQQQLGWVPTADLARFKDEGITRPALERERRAGAPT